MLYTVDSYIPGASGCRLHNERTKPLPRTGALDDGLRSVARPNLCNRPTSLCLPHAPEDTVSLYLKAYHYLTPRGRVVRPTPPTLLTATEHTYPPLNPWTTAPSQALQRHTVRIVYL